MDISFETLLSRLGEGNAWLINDKETNILYDAFFDVVGDVRDVSIYSSYADRYVILKGKPSYTYLLRLFSEYNLKEPCFDEFKSFYMYLIISPSYVWLGGGYCKGEDCIFPEHYSFLFERMKNNDSFTMCLPHSMDLLSPLYLLLLELQKTIASKTHNLQTIPHHSYSIHTSSHN